MLTIMSTRITCKSSMDRLRRMNGRHILLTPLTTAECASTARIASAEARGVRLADPDTSPEAVQDAALRYIDGGLSLLPIATGGN
jgi:hypothetical protein